MSSNSSEKADPIEVPFSNLSSQALDGIIQSFIQREGTDYGAHEASYETKSKQILNQIKSGEIKIIFEPDSESINLVTKKEWLQYLSKM